MSSTSGSPTPSEPPPPPPKAWAPPQRKTLLAEWTQRQQHELQQRLAPVRGLTVRDVLVDLDAGEAGAAPSSPSAPSSASRRHTFLGAWWLIIGVVLVAVGVAVVLILLPWFSSNLVTLLGPFLGVAILVALVPRRHRLEAPGIPVALEDHPRLHETVLAIARAASAMPPAEVYLTAGVEVSVQDVGGRFRPERRLLVVGVPLLHALTVAEFEALLAQQLAHSWPLRRVLSRVLALVPTEDLARVRDLAADRLAARIAGSRTTAAALVKQEQASLAMEAFTRQWRRFMADGFRPRLLEGYAAFLDSPHVAATVRAALLSERAAERLAALQPLDTPDPHAAPARREREGAFHLLSRVDALDEQLCHLVLKRPAIDLEPVAWSEVPALQVRRWRAAAEGETDPRSFTSRVRHVCSALIDAGWTPELRVGAPPLFRRRRDEFHAHTWLRAHVAGRLAAADWVGLCAEAGIAGADPGGPLPR